MSCKVQFAPNGKINKVLNQTGQSSKLFQQIFNTPILTLNQAIDAYKNIYSDKLQSKVKFQNVEIFSPQKNKNREEILNQLKKTGLANNIYQLSNEEIQAKLEELGVDANVAKQVAENRTGFYSNASVALENLKDKNVKNVQGWMKALTDVQKNGGIKNVNQELEWISLEEYLNNYVKENKPKAGNISFDVVNDFVQANQIEIVEVSKGGVFKGVSYEDIDRAELIPNDKYGGYYVYYKNGFIDKVYGVDSIDEAISQSIRESDFAESDSIQITRYEGY